jgi:hypothetical protein
MKRIVMVITLGCVLSVSALAGEIPTVPVAPPPPDEITAQETPGLIPSDGYTQQMSEVALDLVQFVLSAVI